jgi:hypothetical protein
LRSPDSLQHTPNACLRSSTIARFAAETFLTALKAIFCDDEKQLELLEGRLELERLELLKPLERFNALTR